MLYDPLFGEFGITRFDGFASALLDAADIDSTSGDKVLEAAGCLGTNLNPEIIGPAKPVKRYEHLTGFAYWDPELLDLGERGDGLLGAHLRGGHGACFRGERY